MPETTFYTLIDNLEKYLECQRDEGVQRLEVDRAVLAELAKEPPDESVAAEPIAVKAIPVPVTFQSLGDIAAHVSTCRNCPLCQERTNTVPGGKCGCAGYHVHWRRTGF